MTILTAPDLRSIADYLDAVNKAERHQGSGVRVLTAAIAGCPLIVGTPGADAAIVTLARLTDDSIAIEVDE